METILDAEKKKLLQGSISVIIGTEKTLENIAKKAKIPFIVIEESNQEKAEEKIMEVCKKHEIDLIVLARYMKILSPNFVWRYPNRIINIHPSLLPKHGGKGMYGDNVHKAVKNSGDDKSGITIHFVDEEYDKGPIIFQKEIKIDVSDDWEMIKTKVRNLEYKFYPKIIENTIRTTFNELFNDKKN